MSKPLTIAEVKAATLAKLKESNLDAADLTKLKFRPLTAADVKPLDLPAQVAGFLLPYFTIDGKPSKFWRVRYLQDTRKGFDVLNGRKPLRYVQPNGGVNEVYLPPYVDWRKLAETPDIPLVITEGELKAACATKHGYPTIGLGGVYSFKSAKNKEALLPMLREFKWKARQVIICYDSDAVTNPLVILAENQLARTLTQQGALVMVARIPAGPKGEKQGVDDYIVAHGIERFRDVLDSAIEFSKGAALHEMNECVVYVRNPGLIYDYKNNMRLSTKDFLQHAYSNYFYDEFTETASGTKHTRKSTALSWMQWEHRCELSEATFMPGCPKVHDNKLNIWNGWPIEPKKGDVKVWKELLDHLFGKVEPEARKWFEQWCAYPLQNPGAKMASAAVFWGRTQGSGKTVVGHTLMRIYGKYSSEITDTELEDDRFDWAENIQFALADDITANNNRRLANRLKTMITQKTLKINPKYIPRYNLPDCVNYYFTSNDPDAFYLDDGDRRYFIHEVASGKLNPELRKRFIAWRDSDAGIAALFDYLINLDITGFDPQAEPYITHAKADMQAITKSDVAAWVADLHMNPEAKLKLPGDLFTAAELLVMYDPMHAGKVSANGMARELKRAGFNPPGEFGSITATKLGNMRLYAVRNPLDWRTASKKRIVEHYEANRVMQPKAKPAGTKPKF